MSRPGNVSFREIVAKSSQRYMHTGSKSARSRMAEDVLREMDKQIPPGRFLKKDQSGWIEIARDRAKAKTSQALRVAAQARCQHLDSSKRHHSSQLITMQDATHHSARVNKPNANLTNDHAKIPTGSLYENDVLCGHLGNSRFLKHKGNKRYGLLVKKSVASFESAPSASDQLLVVKKIRDDVEEQGGRFLQKFYRNEKGTYTAWIPLDGDCMTCVGGVKVSRVKKPRTIEQKVIQDLRDAARKPSTGRRAIGECPCRHCSTPAACAPASLAKSESNLNFGEHSPPASASLAKPADDLTAGEQCSPPPGDAAPVDAFDRYAQSIHFRSDDDETSISDFSMIGETTTEPQPVICNAEDSAEKHVGGAYSGSSSPEMKRGGEGIDIYSFSGSSAPARDSGSGLFKPLMEGIRQNVAVAEFEEDRAAKNG